MPTLLECVTIEPKQPATACVIWLHGLGADGHDFAGIVPQLNLPGDDVRFIFPHAPIRPVTMMGNFPCRAWFDIGNVQKLETVDFAGLNDMHQTISQLIEKEINAGIHHEKVILAGFSQGGAMALYTGINFTQPLGGILALSTFFPDTPEIQQHLDHAHRLTPIFQAHGLYDSLVPYPLGEQTHTLLKQYAFPLEWKTYPMAHEVCAEEIADIGNWLNERLS